MKSYSEFLKEALGEPVAENSTFRWHIDSSNTKHTVLKIRKKDGTRVSPSTMEKRHGVQHFNNRGAAEREIARQAGIVKEDGGAAAGGCSTGGIAGAGSDKSTVPVSVAAQRRIAGSPKKIKNRLPMTTIGLV